MWQFVMFSVGVSRQQSVGVVCRRLHNGELSDLYCSTVLRIWFNEGRIVGDGLLESLGRGERETELWWLYEREGNNLEYSGIDGKMISKLLLKTKNEAGTLSGLVCPRIETSGGLLWAR